MESSSTPRHPSCHTCLLQSGCIPSQLQPETLPDFARIVQHHRPLRKGDHVVQAGDPFHSIYVLLHGAIKTYYVTEAGEEQVTGFFTAGDFFGFDGLHTLKHTNSAKTLDRSRVCEIPFERLEQLCTRIPALQHYAFQLASRQILQEQKLMQCLSKRSAEARVAFLLLNYVTRANPGLALSRPLQLPMTRYDIANYLGLSMETVSRTLSRLQQSGVIHLRGRTLAVLSFDALNRCAENQASLHARQLHQL